MKDPILWLLEKFFSRYVKAEPLIKLILDTLFIFVLAWFGISLQPQIIHVCDYNFTIANTLNTTARNLSYILP